MPSAKTLLFTLLLALAWPTQAAPQLTTTWQGSAVQIVWADAPDSACLWYQRPGMGTTLLLACGAAGAVQLGPGGDYASLPAPGGVLTLRDEARQQEVAQAVLPWHALWLPIIRR